MFMKRTVNCGQLRKADIGKDVILNGWVQSRRDHGGLVFVDLRDRYGLTQIVFDPKADESAHKLADQLRREFVIAAKGKIRARGEGLENPKLATGEIEIIIDKLEILSKAKTPPIEIDERIDANEDIRLQYRYLDLRKPGVSKNIVFRHKVVKVVRDFFDENGFIEIETPMLAKATPEGARDYLVPSRVNPGSFYALPQSPQLFKQLLMISGMDKYVQIARCFRDEDLRADRQPEFTQIDVEMSYITEEDVYELNERLVKLLWKKLLDVDVHIPFKRMTYAEAVGRYGLDKPDLRFDLELVDVTDISKKTDFKVFKDVATAGGLVKCINAVGCAHFSRKELEDLIRFVQVYGAKGLAYIKVGDELEGTIAKYFTHDLQHELMTITKAKKGDVLLFVADAKPMVVNTALGYLRNELAKRLNLIKANTYNFLWVTDFPLLEWSEEENRFMAMHHPFTSPKLEDVPLLDKDPGKTRARAYDLVLNGMEIAGGSIRIHDSDVQQKMFDTLGITREEAEKKFGYFLEALSYGTPPHGGIAWGLDRLVTVMLGLESIRDVIAFPKNKAAASLMDGCPSTVDEKQLKELHIKLDIVKQ
jgi:aspartyl-tRNA synthetase